jgi:hypothetical protein
MDKFDIILVTGSTSSRNAALCSPSCLVEWAWKLKEGQPKLSKSYPAGYHPAEFEK